MEELKWTKITKDTPLKEIKRIHKEIWDYMVKNGRKLDDAFNKYLFGCSICEYASDFTGNYRMAVITDDFGNPYDAYNFCYNCPIKWPNNQCCPSLNSLFRKWNEEQDISKKSDLAKQIRDLPWKFEVGEDEA